MEGWMTAVESADIFSVPCCLEVLPRRLQPHTPPLPLALCVSLFMFQVHLGGNHFPVHWK